MLYMLNPGFLVIVKQRFPTEITDLARRICVPLARLIEQNREKHLRSIQKGVCCLIFLLQVQSSCCVACNLDIQQGIDFT